MENCLDVLFINVPTDRKYKRDFANTSSMPPLGMMYIASNLQKFDYTVKIVDMAVEFFDKTKFVNMLREENPRIIGISSYVESWHAIKAITKLIKITLPNVILTAGGPFATFCYEQILNETSVDYITFSEGEYVYKELTDSLLRNKKDISLVKGIAYKENGNIILTEPNERIKNLDELEFPNRDLIDLDKYVYPITISTARGCPGNCIFCSSRSYWGTKISFRSPENIIKEVLEMEKKYENNLFFRIDDTFTIKPDRAIKFCELLKDTGKRFIWGCESRADVASEELLQALYSAGCRKIQFGMESGNNEILKKIGKKVTIEQIENAVKIASNIGFDINLSFIIGHAFDTYETIEQTINFALGLRSKYKVNLFASINTPYPGTNVYKNRQEYGIELLTNDWSKFTMDNAVINTKYLSHLDIRGYYQKFMDVLLGKSKEFVPPSRISKELI